MYWCVCTCGAERWVAGVALRSGAAKSCGCLMREEATARMLGNTHKKRVKKPLVAPMPVHLLPPPIPSACQLTQCWFGAVA